MFLFTVLKKKITEENNKKKEKYIFPSDISEKNRGEEIK